jgi:hypothetical protein
MRLRISKLGTRSKDNFELLILKSSLSNDLAPEFWILTSASLPYAPCPMPRAQFSWIL